jgi:hypothetical protein
MARTIFKYPLSITGDCITTISVLCFEALPERNPKVLHVGLDFEDKACVWIEQESIGSDEVTFTFYFITTGGVVPAVKGIKYIDTIRFVSDSELWHCYYTKE